MIIIEQDMIVTIQFHPLLYARCMWFLFVGERVVTDCICLKSLKIGIDLILKFAVLNLEIH